MTKTKRIKIICASILLFAVLASGYRYLSLSYSGDAALIYQDSEEALYQISLGRFMQPVYWLIRGNIVAPFLTGLFATAFFLLSAVLISEVLMIKRPFTLVLLCAILVTNETVSASNATYLPWTDVYALSLLCAVMGAYVDTHMRKGWLISPLFYMINLGLYHSYFTCAATLLVIHYLQESLSGKPARELLGKGIRSIASLFLGLFLYAAVLQIFLAAAGVPASNEYNGVGRLAELTPLGVLFNVPDAYTLPLQFLLNPVDRAIIPWHISLIPAPLNLFILCITLLLFAFTLYRQSSGSRILSVLLLLIIPFAQNFVYLISNAIINGLMIFSFYFFYLLPLLFLELLPQPSHKAMRAVCCLPAVLVIALNLKTANRLAVKRDVEYQSTLSAMTRILDMACQTDGYIPGETKVAIFGYLPVSSISMVRDGVEDLNPIQGAQYTYAASYESSTNWYIRQILGEAYLPADQEAFSRVSQVLDPETLPRYPEKGYCRMVEDILVIKL